GRVRFGRGKWFLGVPVAALLCSVVLVAAAGPSEAAFPGTKGKIAFELDTTGTDSAEIFVMNADGSGPVNLTNTPEPRGERQPAFSPDAKLIACSHDALNDIFVMNPDGSGQVNLTNTPRPLREADPAFSPDGRKIAYTVNLQLQAESEIFVMSA